MQPTFFPTAVAFRAWLAVHHASAAELLVGFGKRGSGRAGMTWSDAVDEALCFGWIDGVRHRLDDGHYSIRFTPRRRGSIWSNVNVVRCHALITAKRMRPAGRAAFNARRADKAGVYSYEQKAAALSLAYRRLLADNAAASHFLAAQPASYRKKVVRWVMGAKRDATRAARMQKVVECSAASERLPQFDPARSRG